MNIENIESYMKNYIRKTQIAPDKYKVPYHTETFICDLPGSKLEEYLKITTNVYTELKRLFDTGEMLEEDFDSNEDEVIATLIPFADGGFLSTPPIKKAIHDVAAIVCNMNIQSVRWLLIYQPSFCSAIYTTAEAIVNRDGRFQETALEREGRMLSNEEWDNIFAYYLLRSFLKVEFGN